MSKESVFRSRIQNPKAVDADALNEKLDASNVQALLRVYSFLLKRARQYETTASNNDVPLPGTATNGSIDN